MAVSVAQDWAAVASGSADPSGAITLPTGSARTLLFVLTAELPTASTASAAIAGKPATGEGDVEWESLTGNFLKFKYFYWDEDACTSISAESSSNISFSDDKTNVTKRHWSYATFDNTNQTTPLTVASSATSAVTSAVPIIVSTTGTSADHVVLVAVEQGTRSLAFDANVAEHWDEANTSSEYRSGLADGPWKAATHTIGHDTNFTENMMGISLVVNSGISITDVDTDETWGDGDTGLVITGTGFV